MAKLAVVRGKLLSITELLQSGKESLVKKTDTVVQLLSLLSVYVYIKCM